MYKETYDDGGVLDPENPVTLTIWHYYNGAYQAAFDKLVEEFNNSAGKDLGIYAKEMPDLFSAYTDSALGLQKDGLLTDLNQYFTAEELDKYVDAYVQEGEFAGDGGLYVFPVAKSTEITMMNKTDWDKFAEETGATLDDLSTVEGIAKVAEQYYDWTDAQTPDVPDDGKAFYGRDSMSNYFLIGMKQMVEMQ